MSIATEKVSRWIMIGGLVLLLLLGSVWYLNWAHLSRKVPLTYASPEQQFNYGAVQEEPIDSVPYWLWLILPRLFPEKLPGPGGYVSLNMNWEAGEEVPIGLSKQTIGFPQVSLNCATCHQATFSSNTGELSMLLTGSTPKFDLQGYIDFLRNSATDPRFNSGYLLNKLQDVYALSWLEQYFYRFKVIPQSKQALSQLKNVPELLKSHPHWTEAARKQFQAIQFERSNVSQSP